MITIALSLWLFSCVGKHSSEIQEAVIGEQVRSPTDVISDTARIDLSQSTIQWKGTKMGGLGKHEGEIKFKSGFLLIQGRQIKGGNFVVDMNSIGVMDIPDHEPIPRRNLNNHLKSDDFFEVTNFPESRLELTKVEKITGDSLGIKGNLSMKGTTKSIEFSAIENDDSIFAQFKFDRFEWNIAYEGNWADKTLVDRDVQLTIALKLKNVVSSAESPRREQ